MGGAWKGIIFFPDTLNMLLFKEIINCFKMIYSLGPNLSTWLNIKSGDQDSHVVDLKKEKSCISLD